MKKGLKIGLISFGSLLAVIIITAAILLLHIFSPSKLAKIVNDQADRFLTCDFHIDNVGLTFFKTFPKVGLDLENVVLLRHPALREKLCGFLEYPRTPQKQACRN